MVCRTTRKPFVTNNGRSEDVREPQMPDSEIALLQDELFNVTTILYMLIESARNDMEEFLCYIQRIMYGTSGQISRV